jgi:hypothetical protein
VFHLLTELLRFAAGLLGCVPRFTVEVPRVAAVLAADVCREKTSSAFGRLRLIGVASE